MMHSNINNRASIFFANHHEAIQYIHEVPIQKGVNSPRILDELNDLVFYCSKYYLIKVDNAPGDEWFEFVFDTCFFLSIWPSRAISRSYTKQQKKEYLLKKMQISMTASTDTQSDKSLFESKLMHLSNILFDPAIKKKIELSIKDILGSFAYSLTHLDRNITSTEEAFFQYVLNSLEKCVITPGGNFEPEWRLSASSVKDTSLAEILTELNFMVGLEKIKNEVQNLISLLSVQQIRTQRGLPNIPISRHMVFLGNPGSGKTTIARKIGLIYKCLGLLSKGHFVETDRSGLVAGYLGQTAIKTKEVLESANGGVLFIDEAYSLTPESSNDLFGQEAIDTILKYMEDNRDDFILIVAGYQEPMKRFILSNPGFESRFNKYFDFPDFNVDELMQIFKDMVSSHQYFLHPDSEDLIRSAFDALTKNKNSSFANGRTVRNIFESIVEVQAARVSRITNPDQSCLVSICPEDLSKLAFG